MVPSSPFFSGKKLKCLTVKLQYCNVNSRGSDKAKKLPSQLGIFYFFRSSKLVAVFIGSDGGDVHTVGVRGKGDSRGPV